MADWVTLFALAGAIYLFECLAWIEGPATACFAPILRKTWTCARGEDLPGNERGGLALLDPMSTGGALVVGGPWPFAMSPDGISNLGSDPWTLANAEPRSVAFEQIQTVHASVGRLEVNGAPFVRLGSVMHAADLAQQIRDLVQQPATGRASAIESAVRDALDEARVQDTWTAFRRETRGLAIVTTGLLAHTFVISPVVIFGIAPHPYWMYVLGGLVGLALVAATMFFRLHSRLYPGFVFERWMHAISMVAVPIAAIRAADKLSRERLRAFSPTAIAPALCGVEAATPLVRRAWFDLPDAAGAPDRCTAWFLDLLRKETRAALDRQRIPVLAPPEKEPAMGSYCPRCHTQFVARARPDCPECAGIQLVSFS